jgi:hypothetical protein
MGENPCQLYIWQGINNQNLQGSQKTKLPKNQQPNEEMGTWTEQTILKGMANKYMKKCSKSLALKETNQNDIEIYLTLVRMSIIMNTNKCWWGFEEKGTLTHCWW